jgi:hypothetical protein
MRLIVLVNLFCYLVVIMCCGIVYAMCILAQLGVLGAF